MGGVSGAGRELRGGALAAGLGAGAQAHDHVRAAAAATCSSLGDEIDALAPGGSGLGFCDAPDWQLRALPSGRHGWRKAPTLSGAGLRPAKRTASAVPLEHAASVSRSGGAVIRPATARATAPT